MGRHRIGPFDRLFARLRSPRDIKRFLEDLPAGGARKIAPDRLAPPTASVEARMLRYASVDAHEEVYLFYTYEYQGHAYLFHLFHGMDLLHVAYSGGSVPRNPLEGVSGPFTISLEARRPWVHRFLRPHTSLNWRSTLLARCRLSHTWKNLEPASTFCAEHVVSKD